MTIKKCWAVFHYDEKKVVPSGKQYIMNKNHSIDTLYHDEQDAINEAHSVASAHPGTTVFLLEAKSVIEAKKPETVAKSWKPNGELIPTELVVTKTTHTPIMGDAVEGQLRDIARMNYQAVDDLDAPRQWDVRAGGLDPFAPAELQLRPAPPAPAPRRDRNRQG